VRLAKCDDRDEEGRKEAGTHFDLPSTNKRENVRSLRKEVSESDGGGRLESKLPSDLVENEGVLLLLGSLIGSSHQGSNTFSVGLLSFDLSLGLDSSSTDGVPGGELKREEREVREGEKSREVSFEEEEG